MRQKLPEAEKKKFVSISISCSPQEREAIVKKAVDANKSVSKFVIETMMRAYGR